MQNKHQEHPEDTILTGDLSAIDLLYNFTHASVKMDGIAIVWGKDPATGTFFVGNKAVFNKKKIRITHSHDEIDEHYEDEMADILHLAFNILPRTDRIFRLEFDPKYDDVEFFGTEFPAQEKMTLIADCKNARKYIFFWRIS